MVASPPTFHPQADAPPAEPPALTASPPLPPMPAPITSLRILPASTPPPPEHSVVATLRSSHVVYVARSPTGLPLLQVGLSDDAGHPPEPENSTQAVDGVEGAEWRLVSEELPGGISVWTASDPHPADELTTPQHAHAYVSDVRVTLSDDAEAMARKGWQTLNLPEPDVLCLELSSPPLVIHFNADASPELEPASAPSPPPDAAQLPAHEPPSRTPSPSSPAADSRPVTVGGWRVGDMLDALDTVNTWLEARVVDLDVHKEQLFIHFEGWAERWNEWIPVRSKRLARYRSNTSQKGGERPFNLRLEADGLYDTTRRLNQLKLALEARAHQLPDPAHPPFTSSHPFAPLTAPLSSLLSPDELHFLTAGDNFKFIGHVVNAQLDDAALLRACLSFLHLNVAFISYAFLTEATLSMQWCEMLARLLGGAHHSFYAHIGVGAADKEEDFDPTREAAEAKEAVRETKTPRQVFASREPAARKGQSVHTYGMSPGVAVPSEKDKGSTPLPSVILLALINRFGREGGFTALQRLLTAQMQPPSTAAPPAAAPPPPSASSSAPAIHSPFSNQPAAAIASAAVIASPPPPPVTAIYPITYLMRGLAAIRLLLEPAFAHSFVSSLSLPALVRHQLQSISDEDLKGLDKSALQHLVKDVQSLLLSSTVYDLRGCVEFAETSTLHMSLRMIQAQVLATRIEGIVQLENTINTVKSTVTPTSSSSSSNPPTSTFTPAFLAQWLEEHRVVESLLGRDSHEQIVKRSPTILKFLAMQHKLQGRHLELLYQAMQGKHEGVVRIVYELLTDLAQVLSEDMLDLVFHRLQEKPLSDYRDFDLHIVRQFTLNAVKNRNEAAAAALRDTTQRGSKATAMASTVGERKWYGLHIFWDLLNEPSTSPAIQQLAATSLAQLLASAELKSQLPVYLDRCLSTLGGGKGAVDGVGSASAVVPALLLAQLMIEKQPEVSLKGINSRSELLGQLDAERKVLNTTVDNLVQYERAVLAGAAGGVQITDSSVVSGHTHGVQLSTRINFLSFLLSSSTRLTFTQAHLELLWSTFITPGCPASDQALLLNWLSAAVNGKDPKETKEPVMFTKKLTRFIFLDLLGNAQRIDYAALTVSGYECFESYFVFVNKDNEALLTASRTLVTVLQHRKLEGVEALWSIVTSVRDRAVLSLASTFLTTLYLRVDATLKSADKRELCRRFIEKTFTALHLAINADGKASKSIGREKEAGKSLIKRGSGSSSSSSLFSSSQDLTIFSDSLSSRLSSLVLLLDLFLTRLSRGDLLDAPRFRAGQQVRATWKSQKALFDAQVRLVNKDGTYLVHYSDGDVDERTPEKNLHSLEREEKERRDREVAREKERREMEARGVVVFDEADDSDAAYPRALLANTATHFELLFRLLGTANPALGQQVSELLAKIPVNAELASSIRQLGISEQVEGKKAAPTPVTPITDWNALLPPTSVPKLLYTLRVIRGFAVLPPDAAEPVPGAAANGAGEAEAARAAVVRWDEQFVMRGGFKQLYHLICVPDARLEEWMDDSLSQKGVALLLELFHTFLALPSIRVAVLDQVDAPKLATRLLYIAQQAAQLAMKEEVINASTTRGLVPLGTALSQKTVAPPMMGPLPPPPAVPGSRPIQPASTSPSPPVDDTVSKLVRYSLLSLNLLLLAQPLLISTILASPAWDRLLSDGILSPLQPFRLALQTSLLTLCSAFPALANFCLPRLLHRLHTLDTSASAATCQEYFDVVRRLILSAKTLAEAQPPPAVTPATAAAAPAGDEAGAAPTQHATAAASPAAPLYDTVELMTAINSKLLQHPMLETSTVSVDHMLLGLLTLAVHILQGESPAIKAQLGSTLIPNLLAFLFDTPTSASRAAQLVQPPKCKSLRSRDVSFAILNELALDCPANSLSIITAILPYHFTTHSSGANAKDWMFEPRHEEKSITGYLGLQNLGCTCYMNAPLQQLFMIPSFRAALLSIEQYRDAGDPPNMNESLLYQVQLLFGMLQESEQQSCSPAGLCHAFKDVDGKPTDVRIQVDSGEFTLHLLDRLCMTTKGTPHESAIPSVLGGVLCHELIGRGDCPHYRERSEDFYGLSLEVQNKKTLTESLQAFIEGEVLEGGNQYKCDQCQRKVDTVKRVCIRSLPPSLFFILKRFQLDYNTMETIKINDRLEFPHYLDMKPYTKEALPLPAGSSVDTAAATAAAAPTSNGTIAAEEGKGKEEEGKQSSAEMRGEEYYQYVLRGVVVHTGSASGGHYYSFIQERGDPSAAATAPTGDAIEDEGRWLKMNDSVVSFFDPALIAEECFGGVEEAPALPMRGVSNKDGAQQQPQSSVFEKYRNGYLVFYDRVKRPVDVKKANQAIAAQFAAASAGGALSVQPNPALKGKGPIARSSSSFFLSALNGHSKVVRSLARLPDSMYRMIWKQNLAYWRDKAVFDRGYFDFVYKLVQEAASKDPRRRAASLKVQQQQQQQQQQINHTAATASSSTTAAAGGTSLSPGSSPTATADGHITTGAADGEHSGDALDAMMQRLAGLSMSESSSVESSYSHHVIQLATRFFLMTFCRARSKDALSQWVAVLKRLYSADDGPSSLWLLHLFTLNQGEWIREYLLECPDAAIRSHIADILGIAISHVAPLSLHLFQPDGPTAQLWKLDEQRHGDAALAATAASPLASPSTVSLLEPSQVGAGVLLEFGAALVGLLNLSAYYWRTFDSYFRLFAHFTASSPHVARWLVRSHGLVGRLLDYFLGEHSLHPELNALPLSLHTQKRLPMRDEYNTAEWHHFLALISQLIVQCQQPQTLPVYVGSPEAALPQLCPTPGLVALTEKEMALLLYPDINNGFLVHLLQLASGRKKGQIVSAFVLHLCYDNPKVSDLVVACIRRGLEWFDWDSVRSYFRVLTSLTMLQDGLQQKRVADIAHMLLEVIARQAKFWKITDLSIDHLIRIARRSPLALQYLHQHTAEVEPLLSFLTTYPEPPVPRSFTHHLPSPSSSIQLWKPAHEHFTQQRSPSAFEVYGLSNRAKSAAIDAIMRGQELSDEGGGASDSDTDFSDRVLHVGEWIDTLDTANKWLCAQVLQVEGSRVLVRYSGWSDKWNEWHDMSSTKILKLGTRTTRKQVEERAKRKPPQPPNTQQQQQLQQQQHNHTAPRT